MSGERKKKGGCRTEKLNDQAGWSNLLITDIGDSNGNDEGIPFSVGRFYFRR